MRTIKPFILSSLALHLLGLGLLLLVTVSPPAGVKTLTVMLVSAEEASGGSQGGGQGKVVNNPSSRFQESEAKVKPARAIKPEPSASAKVEERISITQVEKDQNVTPAADNKATGVSESAGVGKTDSGSIAVGQGHSATAGEGGISRLPGNGMGYGQGFGHGDGNGWSAGGGEHLYLKGGYQLTPAYPASARRQGREGTTYLKIKISPQGKVQEVLIDQSSGHRDLDEAAVEAVKIWRFEPPQRGEQRVSLWARVPIKFQLRNK